ncbi:MAG: NPCBM/NEW2 domain-containing protein [Planctomycetota bacterium]
MTTCVPRLSARAAAVALAALVALGPAAAVRAEEIWLYDNSREYGLVRGVSEDGSRLVVLLPTGKERQIKLEEIIAIRFLGRNPLLVQAGTQEFRFVNGGTLRGQIIKSHLGEQPEKKPRDFIRTRTASAGLVDLDFARVKGFVALPLAGFVGRKAEELVESPTPEDGSRYLDSVLDKRGGVYNGLIRKLERTQFHVYHEQLVKMLNIKALYIAGVRLADAGRDRHAPWDGTVQMRISARDGSIIEGKLNRIHLGKWCVNPVWNAKKTLRLDLDEVSLVQIMGGRVQYLSQLVPTEVKEQTILAPPQPYRMDHSCQGDAISIAGKRYPWGIGVHADSSLTFDLKKRFHTFKSDVGIATRMGERGSVVFNVYGDGKPLKSSGVIRGGAVKTLSVPVKGVEDLRLEVKSTDDLDLGDVANWGSARVIR